MVAYGMCYYRMVVTHFLMHWNTTYVLLWNSCNTFSELNLKIYLFFIILCLYTYVAKICTNITFRRWFWTRRPDYHSMAAVRAQPSHAAPPAQPKRAYRGGSGWRVTASRRPSRAPRAASGTAQPDQRDGLVTDQLHASACIVMWVARLRQPPFGPRLVG